ncbi:hypothetical protein E4U21_007029 [Claviceps maximensis]|nr:hypothetical protein E4U21_007029 [Claviceps maximensis]
MAFKQSGNRIVYQCHNDFGPIMENFGKMLWELLSGDSLFCQSASEPYSPAQHLADMIALIGPPDPLLLQRQKDMSYWRWAPAALNPKGRLCSNAAEFYGGPFFSEDGAFLTSDLIPKGRCLENELPECIIEEGHVDLFLRFFKRMLCWLPDDRATAADLLKDPWLHIGLKC